MGRGSQESLGAAQQLALTLTASMKEQRHPTEPLIS